MKTSLVHYTIACLFMLLLFSCGPYKQKNEVFERVKEKKALVEDTILVSNDVMLELQKYRLEENAHQQVDWMKFKIETNKKITSNERLIKQIKATPVTNEKLLKKIVQIEIENNSLKSRITEYQAEEIKKLEAFKSGMSQDILKIDKELTDLKSEYPSR